MLIEIVIERGLGMRFGLSHHRGGVSWLDELSEPTTRRNGSMTEQNVYEKRKYSVVSVADAKVIASAQIEDWDISLDDVKFGLPEVDDRYHIWRVPVLDPEGNHRLGEVVINAKTGAVDPVRSSSAEIIREKSEAAEPVTKRTRRTKSVILRSHLRNTIVFGDAEETLPELPAGSVDLVFTSPPYFNARPDYSEYAAYEEYLGKMRRIIQQAHRLLADGRFFVINIAPVLIRRANRNEASRRIAVPFDLHRLFIEEGFDFIDDIIWEKPSGAGWATGRGRRFAADRNPLQYKAVPVTEYVLVYRKKSDLLIDHLIRNHPDQEAVAASKIGDDYERTNIWRLPPAYSKKHPAIFPEALVERVIRYYSFEGDVVLDPFAGSGTLGKVAVSLNRRFVLSEMDPTYLDVIREAAKTWLGPDVDDVMCIGHPPITSNQLPIKDA
jgi:DNA modification methylase